MKVLKTLFFLCCGVFASDKIGNTNIQKYLSSVSSCCKDANAADEVLQKCAEEYFIYKGKLINPKIIYELLTWISDKDDQVLSINLEGSNDSNRYYLSNPLQIDKSADNLRVQVWDDQNKTSYVYEVLGKTANGICIIKFLDISSEGSGIFTSLVGVKFALEPKIEFSKQKDDEEVIAKINSKSLVVRKVFEYPLGDRTKTEIKIDKSVINLTLTPQVGHKPFKIKLNLNAIK